MQVIFRLLFLVLDMMGNMYLLSTLSSHQPFVLGSVQLDIGLAIVLFNAVMILIIYIVDFVIVATQRLRIDIDIGEGITNRKRW